MLVIEAGNIVELPPTYYLHIKGSPEFIDLKIQILSNNLPYWSGSLPLIVSGLDESGQALPKTFALLQNYPNPFNPLTMISYQLPVISEVELNIYNLLGQKVATLVKEEQTAGYQQVEWDASRFSSGLYYYQIFAGKYRDIKKMVLLK